VPHKLAGFDRGINRDGSWIKRCAERLIAPRQNRIMNLIENAKLAPARIALLQMLAEIERVSFAGFAVKIGHQVFGSMASWSLLYFLHVIPLPR
jgi:hypothetical protein